MYPEIDKLEERIKHISQGYCSHCHLSFQYNQLIRNTLVSIEPEHKNLHEPVFNQIISSIDSILSNKILKFDYFQVIPGEDLHFAIEKLEIDHEWEDGLHLLAVEENADSEIVEKIEANLRHELNVYRKAISNYFNWSNEVTPPAVRDETKHSGIAIGSLNDEKKILKLLRFGFGKHGTEKMFDINQEDENKVSKFLRTGNKTDFIAANTTLQIGTSLIAFIHLLEMLVAKEMIAENYRQQLLDSKIIIAKKEGNILTTNMMNKNLSYSKSKSFQQKTEIDNFIKKL